MEFHLNSQRMSRGWDWIYHDLSKQRIPRSRDPFLSTHKFYGACFYTNLVSRIGVVINTSSALRTMSEFWLTYNQCSMIDGAYCILGTRLMKIVSCRPETCVWRAQHILSFKRLPLRSQGLTNCSHVPTESQHLSSVWSIKYYTSRRLPRWFVFDWVLPRYQPPPIPSWFCGFSNFSDPTRSFPPLCSSVGVPVCQMRKCSGVRILVILWIVLL